MDIILGKPQLKRSNASIFKPHEMEPEIITDESGEISIETNNVVMCGEDFFEELCTAAIAKWLIDHEETIIDKVTNKYEIQTKKVYPRRPNKIVGEKITIV